MTRAENSGPERGKVVGFGLQERRLGSTILRTYRTKVDLDDIVPNERQPRLGPKEDEELQLQIEANEGLFEPLLVEPHPDAAGQVPDHRRRAALDQLARAGRAGTRAVPADSRRSHRPDADPTTSGSASGFISTASARNGTPRKRRWSPTGSSS